MKEAFALKHLAIHTEKTYTHWLTRYTAFLRDQQPNLPVTTEQKIEGFLTNLALCGMSASSQTRPFMRYCSFIAKSANRNSKTSILFVLKGLRHSYTALHTMRFCNSWPMCPTFSVTLNPFGLALFIASVIPIVSF